MSRKEVDSKIASVTVYENRAQVHRVAEATLTKGVTSVVFDDIPRGVDRDSIQVGLRPLADDAAADAVALNGITFEQREAKPDAKEDDDSVRAAVLKVQKAFEEKKEAINDEIFDIGARKQALEGETAMLTTYFEGATTSRPNEPAETYDNVEQWQKLVEAKIGNDADAVTRRRALDKELKDAKKRLSDLEEQHREEIRALRPPKKATSTAPLMLVHLEAKSDVGKVEVLVSYMMSNASWKAAYDLRVNTKTGQATLTYHALVRQSCGEAWENVNLTMSTAKPAVSGRAPDLTRWYAQVYTPPVRRSKASMQKKSAGWGGSRARREQANDAMLDLDEDDGDEAEMDSSDDDETSASEPARFDGAEVDETRTALSFDVPHQHTVLANNDPVRVSLTVINLTPEITYATRPSAAELAYAILNASNPSNFTVMPGDANVFVDGQFVTKTTLNRIAPKSTFRVGIGQESGIKVTYKAIKEEDSESGGMLSAKKKTREYHRLVVVKNQKDEAVDVRVEHELPTAEDSRVEVKLIEPAPKTPHLENKGEGKLALTLKLQPREEKKVPIVLTVSYPTDLHLIGL